MEFGKKVAHSAMWSFLERGGQQGLSFLVFMVVARFIGPEEYGIANLCFIYFLLSAIIATNLVDGVISQQRNDDLGLSSLFWFTVALGIALAAVCYVTAEPMAAFMDSPKLASLLKLFSIVPFLMLSSALPNSLIQKDMNYKIFAIRTLVATAAGGSTGIFLAYRGFGAYAIIGQQIAVYLLMNVIVWSSIKWRPRLLFSQRQLRNVVRPGLGSAGMNAVVFFDDQAPRFVLGRVAGPVILGQYALAARLNLALQEILVVPLSNVLFPAFASILDDKKRQEQLAERVVILAGSILFPLIA
jgi:O-antigen/teichoic acid export membrane protein